jgi:hypothetical protein
MAFAFLHPDTQIILIPVQQSFTSMHSCYEYRSSVSGRDCASAAKAMARLGVKCRRRSWAVVDRDPMGLWPPSH